MAAKQQDIVVRVFMEKTPVGWQALCVDYNIAAQGETRPETIKLIDDMISSYLNIVFSMPKEEQSRFLNRKAPFFVRLGWAYKFFVYSVFANRHGGDKVSIPSHHHCPA